MGQGLTPRQQRALQALLSASSLGEAARLAGVHRRTLWRWLRQERFRAALAEAEKEALESLERTLVRLGEKAAATLAAAMDNPKASDAARVRAADVVLSRLLQLRELVALDRRVARLEQLLAEEERDGRREAQG